MPFNIQVVSTEALSSGKMAGDAIQYLFSSNESRRPAPIKDVASGGEISRIMLAIKSYLANKMHMPVVLFDEIDTGISGEIARKVGNLMLDMGKSQQVIAITHLPQIASKGDQHWYVHKITSDGNVRTDIRELTTDEREKAIAHMIDGENPSESAKAHAKKLLQTNS
jgi:DNA repair protein RecN (Recombination protein N)